MWYIYLTFRSENFVANSERARAQPQVGSEGNRVLTQYYVRPMYYTCHTLIKGYLAVKTSEPFFSVSLCK